MAVYVIAEAGVNHNGSVKNAFKMIDCAKECGCDCIKFQTFKTDALVTSNAPKADYQMRNTNGSNNQFAMLKSLELNDREFEELKAHCNEIGIEFMSTPFDIESVDVLEKIGVTRYKISSGDINNKQLLQYVAKTGKSMVVSTGMSTIEEVRKAVDWIEQVGNHQITLLHCTSNYPTSYDEVNMKAMQTLQQKFGYPIGYSDHTKGDLASIVAVAMGATVIEKHFTLDKNMEGPDHKASLNVEELKEMVDDIRAVETIMGSGVKQPMKSELNTRSVARKSVVLAHNIQKGEILKKEDLVLKRPGNGLAPEYLDELIGKVLVRNMRAEEMITWKDVVL